MVSIRVLRLLTIVLIVSPPPPTSAVLHGSYVSSSTFPTNPFRGAVMSGGGSGIVLFQDASEAVILTVAHGYDLTYMNAFESMDWKLNVDGGLRLANSDIHGYATSAGGDNIIGSNLGLFRHFSFWDGETCPAMNNGIDPKHTGGNPDDPYACDGLGPDIDVALQRVKLHPTYASQQFFPEITLALDAPPVIGQSMTLVGFGRKNPCRWDGMTDAEVRWEEDTGDALKIAQNRVRAVFYGEVFTDGPSTTDDATLFGCEGVVATAECGKLNGTLVEEEQESVEGGRWGNGCGGDSGGAWVTEDGKGGYSAIGVNRAPGKRKDAEGNWDQQDDRLYQDGLCADGMMDACQSTGSAVATLYPVRKQIRDALERWNPAWAAKAEYACEPPSLENPCCGAGCKVCGDGDGSFDCYPNSYPCEYVESMGSGMNYVCGYALSESSVPSRTCAGDDGGDLPCSALTTGQGWRQEQVCHMADDSGVCPGLTTCCDESRCSTNISSLPTCNTPEDDDGDGGGDDGDDIEDDDGEASTDAPTPTLTDAPTPTLTDAPSSAPNAVPITCQSFTADGATACDSAFNNECEWRDPTYGVCNRKSGKKFDCASLKKKQCKKKAKTKRFCKWNNPNKMCVHKCDLFMGKKTRCLKVKKNNKRICTFDADAMVPGTGCILKS